MPAIYAKINRVNSHGLNKSSWGRYTVEEKTKFTQKNTVMCSIVSRIGTTLTSDSNCQAEYGKIPKSLPVGCINFLCFNFLCSKAIYWVPNVRQRYKMSFGRLFENIIEFSFSQHRMVSRIPCWHLLTLYTSYIVILVKFSQSIRQEDSWNSRRDAAQ